MPMNKSKGNMYGFVTHTWNPIKGKCPHGCTYCYMKRWGDLPELHLDEKELKTDLGGGNYIFVGSGTDMWCEDVQEEWISKVLDKCAEHPENVYLFQSKNPIRFFGTIRNWYRIDPVFCTTIESNRQYEQMGDSPLIADRVARMAKINFMHTLMVTIEPIMDFDLDEFVYMIERIGPAQVNIGADSMRQNLPEPSAEKVRALIKAIEPFTTVHLKPNLNRILEA